MALCLVELRGLAPLTPCMPWTAWPPGRVEVVDVRTGECGHLVIGECEDAPIPGEGAELLLLVRHPEGSGATCQWTCRFPGSLPKLRM